MKLVNRVYRGEISAVDFLDIEKRCIAHHFLLRYYSHRPTMLKISLKPKGTLLIFTTGKFRVMGMIDPNAVSQCLEQVTGQPQTFLLQTDTVTLLSRPIKYTILKRHCPYLTYEPELFPAIHIRKWPDVHVNLFHSGQVVILGRQALLRAREVQQWLDSLDLTEPETNYVYTPLSAVLAATDEAMESLLNALPEPLRQRGFLYLKNYPKSMIRSWAKRMKTDPSVLTNLCKNIGT